MPRVQINDLQEGTIHPVQTAGDTYGGYDKPAAGNDMERLASALGVASQAASQWIKPRNTADTWYHIATNPDVSVNGAVDGLNGVDRVAPGGGGIVSSAWNNGAMDPALVKQAAENDAKALTQKYMQGIKSGLYPVLTDEDQPVAHDRVIAGMSKEWLDGPAARFRTNQTYLQTFAQTAQTTREEVTKMASEQYAEALKQKWQGPVQQGMQQIIKGMDAQKLDDNSARDIWNNFKATINDKTKGIVPWKTLDDLMVGQLRTMAPQNPEAVVRLLELDRGVTKEGVKLGALGDPYGKYGLQAQEIKKEAYGELQKRYDTTLREQQIQQLMSEAQKGNQLVFSQLKDTTYQNPYFTLANPGRPQETKTLASDELRKEAINRLSTGAVQEFRDQGLDPATAGKAKFERDTQLYIGQNVPNPEWKGMINSAATIYGNPTAVNIPGNYEKLQQARQLYETLNTQAPGYLKQTLGLTKEDETFFNRVRVYQNLRGMDERSAMERAANMAAHPQEPLTAEELKNVEQKAANLDMGWWFDPFHGNSANTGKIKRDILDVAKSLLADRDLAGNLDKALDEAKKIVKDRSVLVNGQLLSGDPHITQLSLPAWQDKLNEIAQKHGATMFGYDGKAIGVSSGSELSVRPMAGGSYYQVIKSSGEPVQVPIVREIGGKQTVTGSMPLTIHPNEIKVTQQRMADTAIATREASINHARETMYDPWVTITPGTRVGPYMGNIPKEHQAAATEAINKRAQEIYDARQKRYEEWWKATGGTFEQPFIFPDQYDFTPKGN